MNSQQKSDYENFPMQKTNQNFPIVAQPMVNPMMPIAQPMSNMGNPIVQTNVNQMPSQSTTVNSTAGQVIAPTILLAESEVKSLPPITKPFSGPETDDGYSNELNDPSKPESQQNVENK